MGMFKYSSEVVPTQTLQLNTMKVCLYVFETHDLKLPSAEQEAILSSCKNNSSRWFFFFSPPFHTGMHLTNFKALFSKVWNTSSPQSRSQWLELAPGMGEKPKEVSVGFPHRRVRPSHSARAAAALQGGDLCFFLSPLKAVHTFLLMAFQSVGASHGTEKMAAFCGKGLVFQRCGDGKMGRWYNWLSPRDTLTTVCPSTFLDFSIWYLTFLHGFLDFSHLYFQGNNSQQVFLNCSWCFLLKFQVFILAVYQN